MQEQPFPALLRKSPTGCHSLSCSIDIKETTQMKHSPRRRTLAGFNESSKALITRYTRFKLDLLTMMGEADPLAIIQSSLFRQFEHDMDSYIHSLSEMQPSSERHEDVNKETSDGHRAQLNLLEDTEKARDRFPTQQSNGNHRKSDQFREVGHIRQMSNLNSTKQLRHPCSTPMDISNIFEGKATEKCFEKTKKNSGFQDDDPQKQNIYKDYLNFEQIEIFAEGKPLQQRQRIQRLSRQLQSCLLGKQQQVDLQKKESLLQILRGKQLQRKLTEARQELQEYKLKVESLQSQLLLMGQRGCKAKTGCDKKLQERVAFDSVRRNALLELERLKTQEEAD